MAYSVRYVQLSCMKHAIKENRKEKEMSQVCRALNDLAIVSALLVQAI